MKAHFHCRISRFRSCGGEHIYLYVFWSKGEDKNNLLEVLTQWFKKNNNNLSLQLFLLIDLH